MQKFLIYSLLIASSATFTACKSKVDEAPAAKVGESTTQEQALEEQKPAEEPAATTREVPVNTTDSKIMFVGAKMTGDHIGGFAKWEGTATLTQDNAIEALNFTIDMSSVYSDDDDVDLDSYKQNDPSEKAIEQGRLDKHLMDADFFDVGKFPNATFKSKKFLPAPEGDNDATHSVTGDLTLHGVTKEITFPAKIDIEDDEIEAKADFKIDRFDFDIKYPGREDNLIKKDVRLMIKLEFPIKK